MKYDSKIIKILGRGGFEPPYSRENRFTVCRLQPLGHLPVYSFQFSKYALMLLCVLAVSALQVSFIIFILPLNFIGSYYHVSGLKMPLTRFELVTSPLPRECSASEPQGLGLFITESHRQVSQLRFQLFYYNLPYFPARKDLYIPFIQ